LPAIAAKQRRRALRFFLSFGWQAILRSESHAKDVHRSGATHVEREKRFAIPFVVLSSVGLVAGAAFNRYVLFSAAMAFFAGFNRPELKFLPSFR